MNRLMLDIVATDAALLDLEPEWAALWRRVPNATPFQSPSWLLPWWRVFGTGRPVVARLRIADRLAALFPCYVLDESGERKLLPMGIGMSDYLDLLLEPGLPAEATGLLLATALLAGSAAGAAGCDLADIPPNSALRSAPVPSGWRAAWHDAEPCPVLAVPGEARNCEDAVPARQRRKLRMNRHRAERSGGWRVEFATPDSLGPMLDTLLQLNAHRWGSQKADAQAFHRAAAPEMLRAGLLRLAWLRVGGIIPACCYALEDGQHRLMFYLIGFDPAFAAISPGSLLIGAIIDAAIETGCREVHFLRGNEAYKYAWGATDRSNAACRLRPA